MMILSKKYILIRKLTISFKITKIASCQNYKQIAEKLTSEEKSRKNINYPDKYEDAIRTCFMKNYCKEGIEFINHEMISKQRNVLTHMIKKIGTNIFTGKTLMNISMPINIFDCRSLLEQ